MSEKKLDKSDFIIPATAILERSKTVIPITPNLDIGLCGGIPEGCFGIVSGLQKSGKTTTILNFCKNAQKEQYGKRRIFWDDVEARLALKNLKCVNGLITDEPYFNVIRSTKEGTLSAKDHLNILYELVMENENCVFVIDSISAFRTDKEFDEGIGASTRSGSAAGFMYQFCGMAGQAVLLRNHIVICVMHLMANTSGYGSPWVEKGGNAAKYQCDVHLRIKSSQHWKKTENEQAKPIGQIIEWNVITSALGPPGALVNSYHRFGSGIDEVLENMNIAIDLGLISKAGSWYKFDFLEKTDKDVAKLQGDEKACKALRDDPEIYNLLCKQIKEQLGL